jgi:hypothetical protein
MQHDKFIHRMDVVRSIDFRYLAIYTIEKIMTLLIKLAANPLNNVRLKAHAYCELPGANIPTGKYIRS